MLKLENIYVKEIINASTDLEVIELIIKNKSESVRDVIDLIKKYPNYNWKNTIEEIMLIEKKLAMLNDKGIEPIIYKTNSYSDTRLYETDTMNCADVLPLYSVTNLNPVNFFGVKNKQIRVVKAQLGHTIVSGENYFQVRNNNLGTVKVQKMVDAIKMYEEQIERQSLLTNNKEQNLFTLHSDRKYQIVNENIEVIVLYLLRTAKKELTWGRLSEQMKSELISCAINNTLKDKQVRNNLVTYISNFTTLEELKSEDENVFKRFIIK